MSSLGCGTSSLPALLLQYSYYLNREATKCVNIGIDPYRFDPRIIIFSPTQRKGVHLSPVDWTYLYSSYESVHDFLTYKNDCVWFSSPTMTMKSVISSPNARMIKLRNTCSSIPCRKITLNFIEWDTLKGLTQYLNVLTTKFLEISPLVADYYRTYLHQCKVLNKHQLTKDDYFLPDDVGSLQFNSYRLFNEIPTICEEKLFEDLYGVRGYLTLGTNVN